MEKLTPIAPMRMYMTAIKALLGETHPFDTFQTPSKIHNSGNRIKVGIFWAADLCFMIGYAKYPMVYANTTQLNGIFLEIRPAEPIDSTSHTNVGSLSALRFLVSALDGTIAFIIIATKALISRPPKYIIPRTSWFNNADNTKNDTIINGAILNDKYNTENGSNPSMVICYTYCPIESTCYIIWKEV